ncbi:MAG: hypothetical protein WA884_09220 [Methyloceanibacter sp.]|jgi:hypothetical protein
MRYSVLALASSAAALIAFGCAKPSEDLAPVDVSPMNYEQFSCKQLSEIAKRASQRAAELSGIEDRKPELARLQGEFQTVQQVSAKKGCPTRLEGAQAVAKTRD